MDACYAPPINPALTLAQHAAAGPAGLFEPLPVAILPGARSWINQPFALVPGYRPLRMDLHVPEGATGPVPVVLFAPGGGWTIAPKNHAPWLPLLAQGYAVASIEYRLSSEARYPAPVFDVKGAVRWLRGRGADFGLDVGRIVGWGCSAGGYLMAMAGVTNGMAAFEGDVGEFPDQSSDLSAIIAHYPPTDPRTMADDTNDLPGVIEKMGTPRAPESRLLGFVPSSRPADAADADIATHVSAATIPILLMHGTADNRLGIEQSERLYRALQAVGAKVEYHRVEGANHGGPTFETDATMRTTLAFLDRVSRAPA